MLQPQEEDCTNLAEALEHAVVLKMPPQLTHDPQRAATNQVAPALEDSGGVWQMVSGLMHFQLQGAANQQVAAMTMNSEHSPGTLEGSAN